MAFSLSIRHRLLVSHLFAVVLLAGAFGAYLYYAAAREVLFGLRAQLLGSAALIAQSLDAASLQSATAPSMGRTALTAQLQDALRSNPDLAWVYVLRRDSGGVQVLASSDDAELQERLRATGVAAGITDSGERAALADGFLRPTTAADVSATAGTDNRLIAFAPVPRSNARFAVGVEMRAAQVTDRLRILRLSALLSFLVCMLAALLLSRHLSGRFQGTIGDLVSRCHALANGEPLPPRKSGRRDEFDDVAREFDAMAGRLRHTAESRERANAAVREANERLESRVRQRTAELEGVNVKLKDEIEGRLHVEALLAEAAMTDPLTGLLNRRAMMEMLGQAGTGLRPGTGLSVILADIDHFKRVNDQYGHAVGDQVLSAVAGVVREFFGDHQHNAARWGGEEFLILLPGVRLAAACKRAGQLRQHISDSRVGHQGLRVSISLGVAEFLAGEPLDTCLRRCDQALYRAKEAGRNTVVAAQGALFATM